MTPAEPGRRLEPLGSKAKFWFRVEGTPTRLGLFKYARTGTGEPWAELIAAELAWLLGLPHANYDLATYVDDLDEVNSERDSAGVVSWSFLDEPNDRHGCRGAELLWPSECAAGPELWKSRLQ